ncbi:MAG: DUF924 domain-containing protein [Alphaproteobacteria bacterium]|nr:DUF924 domain-containing protein [Alphaproteobacteria bacterium]
MSEATPQEVLDFWFSDRDEGGEVVFRRAWFEKDDAFDTAIRDGFEMTYAKAAARELEAWREQPHTALALVVTLDQFSRNMFRDDPKMYAADAYAAEIAKESLAKGYDKVFGIVQGWFFYMPLMHSEHLADQEACVTLFEQLPQNETVQRGLESARLHRDIVARFGRFPHRNKIVDRESTTEEENFLLEPNSSF